MKLCCYPAPLTAWDNTHTYAAAVLVLYSGSKEMVPAYGLQKGMEGTRKTSGIFSYEYKERSPVCY